MRFKPALPALFLAAALQQGSAQTIAGSGIIRDSSPGITLSGAQTITMSGGTFALGGDDWSCNAIGQCAQQFVGRDAVYGVPLESRKDDGRGPTIQTVRLNATNWDALRIAPADYRARAQRIHLDSAATDEAVLLDAIHDTHLRVYSFATVDSYLYRQALKHGANYRWVWEPLREKDLKALPNGRFVSASGIVYPKQYDREVPDRVLADIERLLDCAPEDALFLVSDYKVVNPDPFLAVTTPRMLEAGRIFIIDQWDEPGFSDGAEAGTLLSRK